MTPPTPPTTNTAEGTRTALVAERASAFVLILCGLPGAGKTTFAKALVERAKREGLDAFHACFDAYERRRRNDEDAFDREAWRAARVDAMDAATAVVENATNANGTLVVVDDNMYYEGMRWRAFRRMREARASCATAYVKAGGVGERGDGTSGDDGGASLAAERNKSRDAADVVREDVFERMRSVFEPPKLSEPGDGAAFPAFVVDTSVSVSDGGGGGVDDDVWARVVSYWGEAAPTPKSEEDLEKERNEARAITAKSSIHALDIRARNKVSSAVRNAAERGGDVAKVAEMANDARRRLLTAAKALDKTREDVFEDIAELEQRFWEDVHGAAS